MEEEIEKKNVSEEAITKANYNEQYSRKNNVKILDIKELPSENEESLTRTVTDTLNTQGIILKPEDIIAIHRIPTKKGNVRPILLKLKNNTAKANIMRKRKEMKTAGHRLVDDVTKQNHGLINRLYLHPDIESAWFFNGSVYGQTVRNERVRFDIYDNIDSVIAEFRKRCFQSRTK